ncbi:MAG: SIMPL domain-containing protein [Candidatus Marinimicrobia bacterium]|nr:SIMPL domain-containing protein [Candidatus Neomarinimicrobiota bacterium]
MKIFAFILLLIPMLLFGGDLDRLSIEVYGSANIDIRADEVSVVFGVSETGKSLDDAYNKMKQRVDGTIDKLKKYEAKPENVFISDFQSGENYWGGSPFTRTDNFKASTTVTITDLPVNQVESIILELGRNEIEDILNVTYSSSAANETKTKARQKALDAAKAKAQEMAKAMSIKVGPVTRIEELIPQSSALGGVTVASRRMVHEQYASPFNSSFSIKDDSDGAISRFYPRKISIEQHVRVVFQIIQ